MRLSNSKVARLVGVHPITLERWLASGELRRPKILISDGRIIRLWDYADVERLRQYKATNYKKAHS
jgi:predicted site-specific integrase-resolvase